MISALASSPAVVALSAITAAMLAMLGFLALLVRAGEWLDKRTR